MRYPADPPRVEEIVAVMRVAGDGLSGTRIRGLIVVLWRAGLRIQEALDLHERDLDPRGGALVRRGKGGGRREVGMDDWGWEHLTSRIANRFELPVGPLSASSRARPAGGRGRRPAPALSCAGSPRRRRYAAGSPRTNSVTPTRSRWHARAFRST